jgi:hypothetical protein
VRRRTSIGWSWSGSTDPFTSILNPITVVKPETAGKSGGTAAGFELIGTGGLDGSVGDQGLIEKSET